LLIALAWLACESRKDAGSQAPEKPEPQPQAAVPDVQSLPRLRCKDRNFHAVPAWAQERVWQAVEQGIYGLHEVMDFIPPSDDLDLLTPSDAVHQARCFTVSALASKRSDYRWRLTQSLKTAPDRTCQLFGFGSPQPPCVQHVALFDNGREPRTTLRYAFSTKPATVAALELPAVRFEPDNATTDVEGIASYVLHVDLGLEATRAKGADGFHIGVSTRRIFILPDAMPFPFEYASSALSTVKDLTAQVDIDVYGRLRRFDSAVPLDDVTESFVPIVTHVALPLPDEPVGERAVWVVSEVVGNLSSRYEYMLTRVERDHFEVLVKGWAAETRGTQRKLIIPKLQEFSEYEPGGIPSEYLVHGSLAVSLDHPSVDGSLVLLETRMLEDGEVYATMRESFRDVPPDE
jgi:hypothetical protein